MTLTLILNKIESKPKENEIIILMGQSKKFDKIQIIEVRSYFKKVSRISATYDSMERL